VGTVLGREAEMPFSGQEGQVAGVFEQFGEGDDALVEVAFVAVGIVRHFYVKSQAALLSNTHPGIPRCGAVSIFPPLGPF